MKEESPSLKEGSAKLHVTPHRAHHRAPGELGRK